MIYAVDFDGTLCIDAYPNIGAPRQEIIDFIKSRHAHGDQIILWTCRSGPALENAVRWCHKHGLTFDAVNDNLAENIACYSNNSRKVSADFYIDDRNLRIDFANTENFLQHTG